jgi:flavin prenyltransferase
MAADVRRRYRRFVRLIIGITGASGAIYGIRLLQVLAAKCDVETHLVISNGGRANVAIETDWSVKQVEEIADKVHGFKNTTAAIASGSFQTAGMIVAPCSMKTLSSIVHSHADNLLTRAADVTLKEGRKLILMPRETPLHVGHCRLLFEAAQMGIHLAPPVPAFYIRPQTIDDLVDHTVGRVLDLFGVDVGTVNRWAGLNRPSRQRR